MIFAAILPSSNIYSFACHFSIIPARERGVESVDNWIAPIRLNRLRSSAEPPCILLTPTAAYHYRLHSVPLPLLKAAADALVKRELFYDKGNGDLNSESGGGKYRDLFSPISFFPFFK